MGQTMQSSSSGITLEPQNPAVRDDLERAIARIGFDTYVNNQAPRPSQRAVSTLRKWPLGVCVPTIRTTRRPKRHATSGGDGNTSRM